MSFSLRPHCPSLLAATTSATTVDTSLAVKKMAVDASPGLKGTTCGLLEEAAGTQSAASVRETDKICFQESETQVLKQLSSMGRVVVCAGDGATQSSTNLALLRHGVTIWIDVPLDIVAKGMIEDQTQLSAYNLSTSVSYPEVLTHLSTSYEELRGRYAIADATVSVQREVAGKLGYEEINDVTANDMALEVLKEVERLTRVKKMMEEAARPF